MKRFLFLSLLSVLFLCSTAQTTKWGTYPYTYAVDWNLPSVRIGYNASTGMGLGNLQKDKLNLINVNWNGYQLCTNKVAYQAMIKSVCERCKGYRVILVIENEPDNKNVITNTTLLRYENNLIWAKDVADAYGVPVEHGGVMMPAAAAIYAGTLSQADAKAFRTYMKEGGFNMGGPIAVSNAIAELKFCAKYGIKANFHWQQEAKYLPLVIDCLKSYCEDLDGNEFAFRNDDEGNVIAFVNAVEGRVGNAILYNMDIGKNAKTITAGQQKIFLPLVK